MFFRVLPPEFYRRNGFNGTNAIWDSWARKPCVGLFGMLRRVNSLWIIFRTLRACTTDGPTDRIARFNKSRWILLTRTYVVERFWAEFEIRPHTGRAIPRTIPHSLFPPYRLRYSLAASFSNPLCYFSRSVRFSRPPPRAASEKWETASTVGKTTR